MKTSYQIICLLFAFTMIFASCKNETPKVEAVKPAVSQKQTQVIKAPTPSAAKSSTDHMITGDLHWKTMGDVEALVKKDKKKILVDVYTKWCGPCKMMDARTFTDEGVQKAINDKFHAIKFDAEGSDPVAFKGKNWENKNFDPRKTRGRNASHDLSSFFQVPGYPTLVVMDENMNIIKRIVGFKTPEQLLGELAAI